MRGTLEEINTYYPFVCCVCSREFPGLIMTHFYKRSKRKVRFVRAELNYPDKHELCGSSDFQPVAQEELKDKYPNWTYQTINGPKRYFSDKHLLG